MGTHIFVRNIKFTPTWCGIEWALMSVLLDSNIKVIFFWRPVKIKFMIFFERKIKVYDKMVPYFSS